MLETDLFPASLIQQTHVSAWSPGSLVFEDVPAPEGVRGIGVVAHFYNEHGNGVDRPGLVCLSPWTSMRLSAGDIFLTEDLQLVGVAAADIALSAEVDPLTSERSTSLRDATRGALLTIAKSGPEILGLKDRHSPSGRVSVRVGFAGLQLPGVDEYRPHFRDWTLVVRFRDDDADRRVTFEIS